MARSTGTGGATAVAKPKKQRFEKIRQIYGLAHRDDPQLLLKLIGITLAVTAIGLAIGLAVGHPVYWPLVFFPLGVLLAFIYLTRRAERAAYGALEGQPGAAGAVLQGLRRGWSYSEEPVAVEGGRSANMHDAAMVFRAVGRPGVVLIGEGPAARASKLLLNEKRKVGRLTPNVPITVYRIGSGNPNERAGEQLVTPREVTRLMGRLPKTLTTTEVGEVDRRLRALGAQRAPIPKGMDPNRMRSGRGSQFR